MFVLQGATEQECQEQAPKAAGRGMNTQAPGSKAVVAADSSLQRSSEGMKIQALRAVIDSGALSISMNSVQQIIAKKKSHRNRRVFTAPRFSYQEKVEILLSQARSSATYWVRGILLLLDLALVMKSFDCRWQGQKPQPESCGSRCRGSAWA